MVPTSASDKSSDFAIGLPPDFGTRAREMCGKVATVLLEQYSQLSSLAQRCQYRPRTGPQKTREVVRATPLSRRGARGHSRFHSHSSGRSHASCYL